MGYYGGILIRGFSLYFFGRPRKWGLFQILSGIKPTSLVYIVYITQIVIKKTFCRYSRPIAQSRKKLPRDRPHRGNGSEITPSPYFSDF